MEKRRGRRYGKRFVVRYGEQDLEHAAFTNDLSTSGMFIISNYLPNIGARLHIQVEVGERLVYFEGIVARQKRVHPALMRSGKGGFAVRLLSPSDLIGEIFANETIPPPAGAPSPSSPSAPPRAPATSSGSLAPPAMSGRFSLSFATPEQLRKALDEQIRRGGLVIPGQLARESPVERGAEVTIEVVLPFAGARRIEVIGRVLHVFDGGALAIGFDDAAAVTRLLAAFVGG